MLLVSYFTPQILLFQNGVQCSAEEDMNHIVNAKCLETEECDFVTDSDLQPGVELVWRFKGVPYTVKVVDVNGN